MLMEFAFLLTKETNRTLKNQESNREKVNFLPEQNLTFPAKKTETKTIISTYIRVRIMFIDS